MSEEGKRILAAALAHMRHDGGRGRPRHSGRKRDERWREPSRLVLALLDRGPKWGDMKRLEEQVKREHGITRAEFYRLVAYCRRGKSLMDQIAADARQ